MPDAIRAINELMQSNIEQIKSRIYNITSFNPSVDEFFNCIKSHFNNPIISYNINQTRQSIVDSWPNNINDFCAKQDWRWKPKYNFDDAFQKYIIPNLFEYYKMQDIL